jgi:preprotein translocase subunit SecF
VPEEDKRTFSFENTVIIGIGAGVALLVLLAAALVVFLAVRRKKKKLQDDEGDVVIE